MLNLDAIAEEFLQECGICDYGIGSPCRCAVRDFRPVMLELIREVEQLRADHRSIEVQTLRGFAEKVDDMARVGGSPALTEALDAVANLARRAADRAGDL